MTKHHIIITGTGREGTSFILLLTKLGFDNGFDSSSVEDNYFKNCTAGFELDIFDPEAPYIIKRPWICDNIEDIIENKEIIIDHVFLPIRNMAAAAKSRIHVVEMSDLNSEPDKVPGGLWHTKDPNNQESVLYNQLFKLLIGLSKINVPVTLIYQH